MPDEIAVPFLKFLHAVVSTVLVLGGVFIVILISGFLLSIHETEGKGN